ncbi:XTP/dITP diphosphohydrolase [Isobaculum melis]|uniref:XTP/dITP diphosphohydrolase n=1 Tax=Isobaculum melis TaxID=142588 RepID=A0A1H9QVH8_9LACT|nr:XTP/dITP diphosphohydrolase [Isobaculum melis]
MEIIIGTNNQGKLNELSAGINDPAIQLVPYTTYSHQEIDILESGSSYLANAQIKALHYAKVLQKNVLADDGGLELAAFPTLLGVETARFFSKDATDQQKNQQLLALFDQPASSRIITLHAVLVYASPNGILCTVAEELTGEIAKVETGSLGYGFDRIFYLPEIKKTLAELPLVERNQYSPRIRAFQKISKKIQEVTNESASNIR